ncbi:MAG TPA: ABC transporter permease [Defluviitoga sp.]|nr:ABC transporter permease [Defluviitoga sp.]HOP24349.1 ABC transporter permease [Defluviitoga sp.]HPZ28661.1 ABC transporter permease [Defluviitoga sp.]HQD62548.1 ABC transporter permease [Defluviitoga sp.]
MSAEKKPKKSSSRLKMQLVDFWNEFKQIKFGIIGIIFLVIAILVTIFESFLIPFPEASTRWRDITYWEDNPRNAPPAWINWFSKKDYTPTTYIDDINFEENIMSPTMTLMTSVIEYDYRYDVPPIDLIYRGRYKGSFTLNIVLERPDGNVLNLVNKNFSSPSWKDFRVAIGTEAKNPVQSFAKKYQNSSVQSVKVNNVLFAQANETILSNPQPLKGTYKFKVNIIKTSADTIIEEPKLVLSGAVSGILGTDNAKRDIWSGLIAGTKWALFIGLLTSAISVTVGVIYGVVSAYYGGIVDSVMQRIWEIFANIPLLPVLIVLAAIFKPSIWSLIIMMCLFFWVGPVKTVRSMALQIKEETYVEAAKALGASHARIIFKHMVPILIPYSFASMALNVPSAILYEASVSLLGLGDATIVTWGQILHDAMNGGAVTNGLWWWVVPPGIAIALIGMTFAFIGFAMDTILNPKLRTR